MLLLSLSRTTSGGALKGGHGTPFAIRSVKCAQSVKLIGQLRGYIIGGIKLMKYHDAEGRAQGKMGRPHDVDKRVSPERAVQDLCGSRRLTYPGVNN